MEPAVLLGMYVVVHAAPLVKCVKAMSVSIVLYLSNVVLRVAKMAKNASMVHASFHALAHADQHAAGLENTAMKVTAAQMALYGAARLMHAAINRVKNAPLVDAAVTSITARVTVA